ncbi:uncharacterized protein KNAG_0I02080 [Huiozyma naganishii CBS 8797]|uniref:AB hydrolase-1 domain-containing protein n=1 Tax=Huiozyma naganishii (strain ATCC MYA-139 / BCRC 22969 / CBS 8797 / KCTC 17520 / NBRC 10181 / NCYC 3082 / Yp74L-3) TaxID=1071383 RepID=J7RQE7_HUIN7|nr:hypothetical protein KNAG_0I02080 [Kazachstania naganishii CBS 8797]CCK71993.1 hypothetical protein KNAG_0I02080 [Kazachstania naganishii CBS 8797]
MESNIGESNFNSSITPEDADIHLAATPPEESAGRSEFGAEEGEEGEENTPLINKPKTSHPVKSHRNIGDRTASYGGVVGPGDDRNTGDSEAHGGDEPRFQTHKDYSIFQHNWRWTMNVILFINTLFLVFVFICYFFLNFGFGTGRNESFDKLLFISVALIGNCFNLWFNDIWLISSWDYFMDMVLTGLPLTNLALFMLTSYTRTRLNFSTVMMFLWLALTFGLSLYQSYKLQEYIKQLAPETVQNKHTLKEWIKIAFRNVVKILCCGLLFLMTLNSFLFMIDTHNVANFKDDDSQFVYADSQHSKTLHIKCSGLENHDKTKPIVLYEHGGEDTSYLSGRWIQELYHLGKIESYCVYDRFGYGLSDSTSAPWSLKASAEALRYALVDEMKLEGPFVVVGYDYGGLVGRVFVSQNRDICSGLMLVESWHEELLLKKYFKRLFPGDGDDNGHDGNNDGNSDDKVSFRVPEREIHKRNGLKVWWNGLWSSIGLNLHYSWMVRHRGSRDRILGRDMQHQGKFLRTKFLEVLTSSLLSYKDILETNPKLRNVKLSVVSSKEMVRKSSIWGDWQRKLTKLSGNTKEWKIVDGEHNFYQNGVGKELAQDVLLRLLNE